MRQYLYKALLILMVCLHAVSPAQAQLMQVSELPWPVELQQYMVSEDIPDWGYPEFRMFGWSPDGKVAWSEVRAIDGRGGTQYHFVIFDAVADTVVWEEMDDSFDWMEDLMADSDWMEGVSAASESMEESTVDSGWSTAWSHVGDRFETAMAQFGVALNQGVDLLSFPLALNGDDFSAELVLVPETEADRFMDEVKSYQVLATSRKKGKKILAISSEVTALRIWISGCFLSPFEDRMLVVVSREQYIFEGSEVFYHFAGCNLKVGFH
ncbi:MAG: hypothetical protein KKI09_06960 [Spirochaetes bacterium]|nr:hypothetical protein [Spirochaetota bacterium]MBU0955149.1 hypothetical protein [Spirochaetota bacterium]